MTRSNDSHVGAVDTTIRILETLREDGGKNVTELAKALDISKANAHKHLTTLADHRFVKREGIEYRLGLRFFEYGTALQREEPLFYEVDSILLTLAETTDRTAGFVINDYPMGLYLYSIDPERKAFPGDQEGERIPLQETAPGRVILAWRSESGREDLNSTGDESGEERSESPARIRDRGVAVAGSTHSTAKSEIAAPVKVGENVPVAAVSLLVPEAEALPDSLNPNFVSQVKKTADVISKRIAMRHSGRYSRRR